ncbi:MAG: FAD-binding oxidoreductase [Actinobacteria bacterium]|nr:FAD-binding oxidoreductase [Actinomycetota bacterium]
MQESSAEVVVIGGGVVGASIAFHLAEASVDVALIEKSELGAGSTSKAAGGLRTIFSDDLNIEIALRSIEAYRNFSARPGHEVDFKVHGYLILISREDDLENFRRIVERQNAFGIPSRIISPEEAGEINPMISTEGLIAALHSPADAQCSPEGAVMGYAQGARKLGAKILQGEGVMGIDQEANSITAVHTASRKISTSTVVIAAGVWSPEIGEMIGLDIPVKPYKREIVITDSLGSHWSGMPDSLPMTIDFSSTLSWRPEGGALLIGFSDERVPAGFDTTRDPRYIEKLAELALHRIPITNQLGIGKGWAGLYDTSPDNNALLGEANSPNRVLYATGFSGHGVMQAPAVGEIIRDLYLGQEPFVDISPLSVDRFKEARARRESAVF